MSLDGATASFADTCQGGYDELALFTPMSESLTERTFMYDAVEFCALLEQTFEAWRAEVQASTFNAIEPSTHDYVKALNVIGHELYIEKQRTRLAANCFASVLLEQKREASTFCDDVFDPRVDLTLWTHSAQRQACLDALKEIEHLSLTSDECYNHLDSPECSPCSKVYDSIFSRYRLYVDHQLVSQLETIAKRDNHSAFNPTII